MTAQLLPQPSWFSPYGEQTGFYDKDGWCFWCCIGSSPDGFVVNVFRTRDGATEKVPYSPILHHGLLSWTPRGLVLTGFAQWSGKEAKRFYAIDIQGFANWGAEYTGTNKTVVVPLEGIDSVARGQNVDIRAIATGANDKVNAVRKQVDDHFKNHPTGGSTVVSGGLTEAQVSDIAWKKANDALYNAVVNADANGYFAQGVRKYAPASNNIPAQVDMDKLVTEIKKRIKVTTVATSVVE